MRQLFSAAALVALISATGAGFAQQQPAPSAGPPQLSTCSQQAAYCKSGCDSYAGARTRQCVFNCDKDLAECKATGFWKNLATGKMMPRRKE